MDRLLYIAMTGAKQTMLAQAANANNLANANTTAFRADFEAFRSMPVFGPGLPSRVYAMTERPGVDFTPGALKATGRDLDVAIDGKGWIAVQAADGSEAYTRAGELSLTATGQLVTANGLAVIGNGGPIAIPPAEKIDIGTDGTISIRPQGQTASALATIDRIKLIKPEDAELTKGADGLIRAKNGTPFAADANVRVLAGSVESSNVNSVEALVSMLTLSRQFEMQVKAMKAAEDADSASVQMMRLT